MTKIINIEEGQFLNFLPPKLDGGKPIENKRRYMLVIENDIEKNIIKMINVSKLSNKVNCLWYDFNIEIEEYYPLKKPSFAKVNTTYLIENFDELKEYISFNGERISNTELEKIKLQQRKYNKIIKFTKSEFKELNKLNAFET